MIHELQILVGNVDGVNIICVYYQTLANTRKEILLQLVKGFHKECNWNVIVTDSPLKRCTSQ